MNDELKAACLSFIVHHSYFIVPIVGKAQAVGDSLGSQSRESGDLSVRSFQARTATGRRSSNDKDKKNRGDA
jgi:hypothetical protein